MYDTPLPLFESQGQENGFFSYELPLDEKLLLNVAGGTKKGIGHANGVNEDSYLAMGSLLAIADGVGGMYRGDIASRVVSECLALYGQRNTATLSDKARKNALIHYLLTQPDIPKAKVLNIQNSLNHLTKRISQGQGIDALCSGKVASARTILKKLCPGKSKEMDTTIVAAEFRDGKIFWYHQGDSCLAYIPLDQPYLALALPDTLVTSLVATVSLPVQEREVQSQPLQEGDTYVLFSDALLLEGMASKFLPLIPALYQQAPSGMEVPFAAWRLIQEAWKGGDDTTIILARIEKRK